MVDLTQVTSEPIDAPRFQAFGVRDLPAIGERYPIHPDLLEAISVVAEVLPFRVNPYVLDHLIDWAAGPDDPIFQMVFPQPGMLDPNEFDELRNLRAEAVRNPLAVDRKKALVAEIRSSLNPQPDGQVEENVPTHRGLPLRGVQHKYRSTVLSFPANGQTCHSYCTYCFRWAQFVGDRSLRFAASSATPLVEYLHDHPEVTEVLVTGGDPMVMSAERLRAHIAPLLEVPTIDTIRIGTKALAYWPMRFTSDPDAAATLEFFSEIVSGGRSLAVMAHVTHPRELATPEAATAVEAIRSTGARLFGQAPLVAHVNDSADVWADMWTAEHRLGLVPYYMFVERDTGPRDYFQVSLPTASEIFTAAYRSLPGLARTVRGPVMSCTPGKVLIGGELSLDGDDWLALEFVQARCPELVGRPFLARRRFDTYWADQLELHPSTPTDIASAIATA
ncbi:MAG: KamA family radical SAM protein [Actinomycetes bacterium]